MLLPLCTALCPARRGSVLLLVLWLMIGIGVVSLSYTASVRSQYQSAQAAQGRTQAYWAARAGVEKARALLREADLETLAADDKLFGDEEEFKDQSVGQTDSPAKFSIYIPAVKPGDPPGYGLIDEAARINLNTAPEELILELPDATQDLRDALLDWRDGDGRPRPLGGELDYYAALDQPTVPRDGPLYSLRELLRVRDWNTLAQAAYPDAFTRYATLDPEQRTSVEDQEQARKLLAMLTVWSRDARLAPDGKERMMLNNVTAATIRQRVTDLTEKEANAIVKHREGKEFEKLTDLLEVKEVKEEDKGSGSQGGKQEESKNNNNKSNDSKSQNSNSSSSGDQKKIFDLKKVAKIIDYFTIKKVEEEGESGLINLNTASSEVFALLPDLTDQLAEKIIERRKREAFKNGGQIADVDGVTEDIFKKVYPVVTARSQCFHAWVRGYEPDSGASATIETVLAVGETDVTVIYWRED